MKAIFASCVSSVCSNTNAGMVIYFNIRFYVIEGILPFLIGLTSLVSQNASLKYRYSNIWIINWPRLLLSSVGKANDSARTTTQEQHSPPTPLKNYSEQQQKDNNFMPNHHNLDPQRNYYTPAAKTFLLSFKTSKRVLLTELRKLHDQHGQRTATPIEKYLREA